MASCSICDHPRRGEIERAIAEYGDSIELGGRKLSKRELIQHKKHPPLAAPSPGEPPSPAPLARATPDRPAASTTPPEDPAERVKAMLDEGAPRRLVYDFAERAVAGHLGSGMSLDKQRAWSTLMRVLRQASSAEGDTIDRHPDFPGLVEDLVAAVVGELGPTAPEGLEGRIADRFEELQVSRAEAGQKRRAA